MATEPNRAVGRRFLTVVLPALIGAAAFLVYALTLGRWVSFYSVIDVARISGWIWQPELLRPLTATVLWPFGLLPEAWVPMALNWFTAGCGALAVALLARSIALLPHDMPPEAGARSGPRVEPLGGPTAWLPPVLAAMVCGLQLTFWEQATSASTEMVNLLVFACLVLNVLEYRIDHREARLSGCAFLYAAGVANDWSLMIYFPLLLVALVRVKGLAILNGRFWLRLGSWAAAGLSLYLLLPCLASFSSAHHVDFWPALKRNLLFQKGNLNYFRRTGLWPLVLTTFLPLGVVSFRWKLISTQSGDDSPAGVWMSRLAIHSVHAICLAVSLWIALDAPLSARSLGTAASPLVQGYLSALVAAYCVGHFLVLGAEARATHPGLERLSEWRDSRRWVRTFAHLRRYTALSAAAGVCLLPAAAPVALVWRNWGQVQATTGPQVRECARELYDGLPAGNSVVLSDDMTESFLLQAELRAHGNQKSAVLVDTRSVGLGEYQHFVARQCEAQWPRLNGHLGLKGPDPAPPFVFLSMLATNAPLVCLHPSLDYCLEWYAARPRGSVVRLFPRDADKVSGRALDAAGVAANDHYWQQRWTHSLQTLAQELTQPTPLAPRWASRLCQQLRLSSEPTRTLTLLAAGYSRCLDSWGVSLQRAGQWPQAGLWFQRALELNPANLAAQINSEYNQRHQRGDHARLAHDWVEARFVDQSARFRSWTAAVEANGPVDEPTSLFTVGATLVGEGKYVQAARDFGRCADLAPDWLDASIGLAQIRVLLGDYQGAFSLASNLESSGKAKDDMDEAKIVSCRAAALKGLGRGQEAVAAVEGFAQEHHERAEVLSAAAQLYLQCGRFAPALALLDQLLAQSPNDPSLLLYKGSAEIGLAHFPDAIATLTKALTFAPASPAARINRAIACLRSGQLDAARDDYEELLQHFPNSPPVLFGLGEIAWRRQDTNAAIGLYERYLASTALGSDESKLVSARLKSLRGP